MLLVGENKYLPMVLYLDNTVDLLTEHLYIENSEGFLCTLGIDSLPDKERKKGESKQLCKHKGPVN